MANREIVIKALECRKNAYKRCENPCEEIGICHYAKAFRDINGEIYRPFICDRERICTDAIALLKEHEAIEPVTKSSVYDPDIWFFVCGSCKKCVIDRGDKFCRWCGQAVKWND